MIVCVCVIVQCVYRAGGDIKEAVSRHGRGGAAVQEGLLVSGATAISLSTA